MHWLPRVDDRCPDLIPLTVDGLFFARIFRYHYARVNGKLIRTVGFDQVLRSRQPQAHPPESRHL